MPRLLVCGSINWDTIIYVDEFPSKGEEVKANNVMSLAGGKGGNTAVAAARILDDRVGIIGVLGYDQIADKQLELFERDDIDTSFIFRREVASGQAYVVIDKNGENTIYTYKAANYMLKPEDIRNIVDGIDRAEMIIVIDPPLEAAKELINIAYEKSKKIIFIPALLTKHGLDKLEDSLRKAGFIILNEHEARALVKDDTIIAGRILSARFGKVIITRGKEGCIYFYDKEHTIIPTLDLDLFDMKSVSSVGAGDTFAGSFGAFLLRGFNEIESLFLANIAAALKTTKHGARESPRYEQVMIYLTDPRVESIYNKFRSFE